MSFTFTIPTPAGSAMFEVAPGTSLFFVGANGGGKTRLAVKIEEQLEDQAHRIAAHRALALNPRIAKISEEDALKALRYGGVESYHTLKNRAEYRWERRAAVAMLSDYDFVVQALFADQANVSLKTHQNAREGTMGEVTFTKFERLAAIWSRILPQRRLKITGDDVHVASTASPDHYPASDMSDGERAVFYLLGQALLAASDSLIVFDEPELHIHRAIMARLWDELEAARPDCALVVISHDLEFVASREGQKCVLRDYHPATGWLIENVPVNSGFSEEITTLILGSRRPILFVEGDGNSLDQAIYRACYPEWTLIPRGACEQVIHAVATLRGNAVLTRVTCAGIVDADDYQPADRTALAVRGIEILDVSEIENLFVLPDVLDAILAGEGYAGADLAARREALLDELFALASDPAARRASVLRFCRRRIDRALKKVDLSAATDATTLAASYAAATSAIDVAALAQTADTAITDAVSARDAPTLLRWFDNKGVLAIAAKARGTSKTLFEQWVVRAMRGGTAPALADVLRHHLPLVVPR